MTDERASRDQRRRRRLLMKLASEQDDLCFYCDKPLDFPDPDKKYGNNERNNEDVASFDHVVPRSKNGRTGVNLVIAHRHCNSHRNVTELDDEQTQKLIALNERRQHLFSAESGKTCPGTFGIVSLSSFALAEKVDEPGMPNKMRGKICSFCQKYSSAMRELRYIRNSDEWQYISDLVLQDYLRKLEDSDLLYKTYIASILNGVRMNDLRTRFQLANFAKLDYKPEDHIDRD